MFRDGNNEEVTVWILNIMKESALWIPGRDFQTEETVQMFKGRDQIGVLKENKEGPYDWSMVNKRKYGK